MRLPRLAVVVACVAASPLAIAAHAASPRALFVHVASPGAPPETTWVEASGNGVRVLGDGSGTRVAPPVADAGTRWIVRLSEPASAAPFVERVAARHALADRFVSELSRRQPGRFGASGAGGIRVLREFDRLIAGVALEAPAASLPELRATPGVVRVDPDQPVHPFLDRSVPQVGGDKVRNLLHGTGRGVRVGIVDTGIDYHHAAFGGAFGPGTRVAGGDDLVNHDGDPMDDNGHGTHVAGIVAGNGGGVVGMAVEATLYAYKVLNQYGGGFTSDVIAGLERCADPDQDPATDDRLDVVNLSLGAYGGDPDDEVSSAVDSLAALGTTVVVAAGNDGAPFTIGDPAIARGAIAVGATMRADTTAPFSSRGPGPDMAPKPDLVAPGDGIVSAAMGGGKIAMSGTSMAAPHVAGAAALLIQLHRDWTGDEVRAALVGAAHNLGRTILDQGAGRLDAYAAATATLFAIPSRIAFGRIHPGGPDTTLTRTLEIRSHATTNTAVTLEVEHEYRSPGVDVTVEPAAFTLAPDGDTSVVVRATVSAARAVNLRPPFIVDGLIEVRGGSEVRHVPYSIHDCDQMHVAVNGNDAIGVVHDDRRPWPSKGILASTWLLPAGDYDVMAFGSGIDRPVSFGRGLHLDGDRDVDVGTLASDRTLSWSITDEAHQPLVRAKMDLVLRHIPSGASLGYVGFTMVPQTRLPEAGPDYTLEWAAYQDDGDVRHDIPGAIAGPFTDAIVANDPSRLRRYVEHFEVTPGDSVLPVEYRLHPDGAGGEWGIALLDPFATPTGASYDVVQMRSATPYPGHYRIGRWDWQFGASAMRGGPGEAVIGFGPPLALDHGDTVGVHRTHLSGPPLLALTGSRFAFGSGPLVFNGYIDAEADGFVLANGEGFSSRLFADMLGTKRAGPSASFEVLVDGHLVLADSLAGEGAVENVGLYQRTLTLPRGLRGTMVVHSPEASVLGIPSHTTVRAAFSLGLSPTITPSVESFAVVADGSVVEEVRFGQVHDPHVEFSTEWLRAPTPVDAALYYQEQGSLRWSPLTVIATDSKQSSFRAALPPVEGPVSLRLEVGTAKWGTLQMDVEPAFVGKRSPAADASVMEASATAASVQVSWRVPAIDGSLVVQRTEAGVDWADLGDVTPVNGIARFEDPAIVPGARYGYRLAGSTAAAWVQVPAGAPRLSLAIAPNPARGDLLLALGVDRTAPITITLLDVQGRAVRRRVLDGLAPGVHVVNLTPSEHVRPGLYFVRLERGSDEITRRVTLLQ